MMKKTSWILYLAIIFLLLAGSGCATHAVFSLTDSQPYVFQRYTGAWLGEGELLLAYQTDREQRWSVYSLGPGAIERSSFSGVPTISALHDKQKIPIIFAREKSLQKWHRRNGESLSIVDRPALGNMYLVPDDEVDIGYALYIAPLVDPPPIDALGLEHPVMPRFQPWWTYPTRIILLPFAVVVDVATVPLVFVSIRLSFH